jgi:ribosomal protein S19
MSRVIKFCNTGTNIALLVLLIATLTSIFCSFYSETRDKFKNAQTLATNLKEPDPLTFSYLYTPLPIVSCHGGLLNIPREITTSKPIVYTVEQSAVMVSGTTQKIIMLPTVKYTTPKITQGKTFFKVTIPPLPVGKYLYSPIVKYQVNPDLFIEKPIPSHYFEVFCDEKN